MFDGLIPKMMMCMVKNIFKKRENNFWIQVIFVSDLHPFIITNYTIPQDIPHITNPQRFEVIFFFFWFGNYSGFLYLWILYTVCACLTTGDDKFDV